MGCPNKSARFKVHAFVVLLGWRHWKFNVCHLSFLRLKVVERYTKEQRVIIVKTHYKYGEMVNYHVISRNGNQHWPPFSCDLTLCGFFLWGGVCEISCLCQQTPKNSLAQGGDSTCQLAKLSRNYAEMSSRISSKEQECASRVVGEICRIFCSTINCSVCTLYWNKNISTFLINGVFITELNLALLLGHPILWVTETFITNALLLDHIHG